MNPDILSLFNGYKDHCGDVQAAAMLVLAHVNSEQKPLDDAMSPAAVAKQLNVKPATIRNLCRDGAIRYTRVGRAIRIKPQWVSDYEKSAGTPLKTGSKHW